MEKPILAARKPKPLEMEVGEYWWCACGKSANQPFCDGSHKGSGILPVKVQIEKKETVYWCMCKNSYKKPFCDGSHREL